ncbi:MAG TPA: zinc ribbon domain-containing protein [Chloroflexia bacterium]|nr:zinc ribbon domain-containing protein [Chloroflexia bacterium]
MQTQQVICPNCHADNVPGALACYRCNTKLPGAPGWTGPVAFKVYDGAKDRGLAYMFAILGGIMVVVSFFLAWLGVPKEASDATNRGTSGFDILAGAQGSHSAIGNGGVGESSVGLDVRLILLVVLVAAFVAILSAIIKPLFGLLLLCGLIILAGPVYFFLQLVLRNNAQFNTPDLVGLLRVGFYGAIAGAAIIMAASFSYRKVETYQSGIR